MENLGARRKGNPVPDKAEQNSTRLGLTLFFLYAIFYFGFVLVNAFAVPWVDWKPFAGLNLAIVWGFALIVLACVLSLVYGLFSADEQAEAPEDNSSEDTQ